MLTDDDYQRWREGVKVIYALCDPDGTPRYVGQTYYPQLRFETHLSEGKMIQKLGLGPDYGSHKERWLYGLLVAGKQPILKWLEIVPIERANKFERRWIAWFESEGHELVNRWAAVKRKQKEETVAKLPPLRKDTPSSCR